MIWVLGRQWLQFVPLNAIRRIDAGQPSGHSLNDSIAVLRFVSTYEEVREFVRINSWLVGQFACLFCMSPIKSAWSLIVLAFKLLDFFHRRESIGSLGFPAAGNPIHDRELVLT